MKRLLILVDNIEPKKQFLVDYLKKNFSTGEVFLAELSDLVYDVNGRQVSVIVSDLEKSIDYFSLVYFRRTGSKYSISALNLALCLKHLGIKFFDTAFLDVGAIGSKWTSYLRLSLAGLPTIPSFFCFQKNIDKYKDLIIQKFGLPLIAKELSTQRGAGIFLIKNKDDFDKLPPKSKTGRDHTFMFQKYIKNDEEYRMLVLGNKVGSYLRKHRTDPNEFRSNAALGAREEFLDVNKMDTDLKEISIKAAKVLNLQIAGVDIFVDKRAKMWLLEANRGPGLTPGSTEFSSLASYLESELGKND